MNNFERMAEAGKQAHERRREDRAARCKKNLSAEPYEGPCWICGDGVCQIFYDDGSSKSTGERRRQKTRAPDILSPMEQALEDRNTLARSYRAAIRKEEAELLVRLLEGPHAVEVKNFMAFMKKMKLEDGDRFLDLTHGSVWLCNESKEVRSQILHIIGRTIYRMREREGLAPYDDAIFEEELTVFDRIKELLA